MNFTYDLVKLFSGDGEIIKVHLLLLLRLINFALVFGLTQVRIVVVRWDLLTTKD